MIIRLMNADFSGNNIGVLNTWHISWTGDGYTVLSGTTLPTSITKGEALNFTVGVASGYTYDNVPVTITMDGTPIQDNSGILARNSDGTLTINIASVTGKVVILIGVAESGGGSEVYDLAINNGNATTTVGVEGMYLTSNTRLTNGSDTEATGILLAAGKTITLTGLAPSGYPALRFDTLYCSSAGPMPTYASGKSTWEHFVKMDSTAAGETFPNNADGNNTCSITNSDSTDYYIFFAFTAPDKSSAVTATNYSITYTIS